MPFPNRRLLIGLLAALWLLLTVMILLFIRWQMARHHAELEAHGERLPVHMPAPDFELQNRDGRAITPRDLHGRPWIADFIFTRCPGVCPVLTRRMKEIADALPPDQVRFVSISVDPENDTPEALEAYAQKNEAGENWLFLTGEKTEIAPLIQDGFKLAYDPAPGPQAAEAIVHSNRFVLVDAEGQIRGYYNAFEDDELAQLRLDARSLFVE